jgi:hypothetical protein
MRLPTWMSAPSGAAPRPLRLAVGLAALGALAVGLFALVQHLALFVRRAPFPLDLEWMEGGMLLHARRLLDGQPLYAPPSLDFIPYLYTPLYPALLALLSKLLPFGYLLGRGVSIAAFAGALTLLVVVAARQGGPAFATGGWSPGGDRWLGLPTAVGVAAAGLVAASFAFTGSFYDLVRADSLLLLLEAAALTAALLGGGPGSAVAAGLLIALAFFTKQTASLLGVAIGLGLLIAGWRRGLIYGLVASVALAAGLLLLNVRSGGWFWRYVFELHQSHGFNARLAYVETPLRLLRQYHWLYTGLGVAVVALALQGRLHRRDAIHLSAALAGFAAACIGFGTQWAFDNAFIPAVYFPAYSLTLLGARLTGLAFSERQTVAALPAAVASMLVAGALAASTWPAAIPDRRFEPRPADRVAAARFLDKIRALPGPLFIPFHPYYPVLAGSPPHVHRMGVLDVAAQLGRPAGLDQALAEGRFAHVILDWKSQPWEWPTLEGRYHEVHQFTDGVDAVRAFSGAETSPRRLLARTTAAPPLADRARRVQDFEAGWPGWTTRGDAFGGGPAPAQAGMYGRAAADSRRLGPAVEGTLSSPPLRLDRPRLRFRLDGPADASLRVLLLDGPEAARSASPTGKPVDVEWDVAALKGRPLTLVVEDRSAAGGLAIDEIVSY